MTRLGIISLLAGLLVFPAGPAGLQAQTTNTAPDFSEVYDLIRAHLPGATDADLNRTAVRALVSALSPKVALVTNGAGAHLDSAAALLNQPTVFDGEIAYLRVNRVDEGLATEV